MNVIEGGGARFGMAGFAQNPETIASEQRRAALEFALRWACAGQGQVMPAADFIAAAKLFDAYVRGEPADKVDSSA